MNTIGFTTDDIYQAYRKFKSFVYYDNASLFMRQKIADFEVDIVDKDTDVNANYFKDKFTLKVAPLLSLLNSQNPQLQDEIDVKYLPKKVELPESSKYTNRNFITNQIYNNDELKVTKYNLMIDASIEIHIISVLWIMFVGKHLKYEVDNHNFAYNLTVEDIYDTPSNNEDSNNGGNGLRLFEPYFKGYQKWRDKAIECAIDLLDKGRNASILSLDITKYFYSTKIDLNHITDKVESDKKVTLNSLLTQIHKQYTNKAKENIPNWSQERLVLPVGLLSSGLIANLYLSEFDSKIIRELNPAYYGRYVDDMLFVFSDRVIEDQSKDVIQLFINKTFCEKEILTNKLKSEDIVEYEIKGFEDLTIQPEKIILEHFLPNESRAAINKFKANLDKQRSEFRFLPDEERITCEFDDEAFALSYSDSINKLRSIDGCTEDKYGASKFLANKIFLSSFIPSKHRSDKDKKQATKSSKQILSFFKGKTTISFYTLWEKVATYFAINEDIESLNKFVRQAKSAIGKVKNNNSYTTEKLQKHLSEYLSIAVSMPVSMNLKFSEDVDTKSNLELKCTPLAMKLRYSNMFRNKYLASDLINYTNALFDGEVNLFSYDTTIPDSEKLFNPTLCCLSPRFVHNYEISIFLIKHRLHYDKYDAKEVNSSADNLFNTINYNWRNIFGYHISTLPEIKICETGEMGRHNIVTVKDNAIDYDLKHNENKRIAIANIDITNAGVLSSLQGDPILSKERRETLFNIINSAVKEKCDVLVLPELAVPFQWLDFLAYHSKSKNIAIITGLEYYISDNNKVYNCVATILPTYQHNYMTSVIWLRVKNHYSPEEEKNIVGYGMRLPTITNKTYDLFHWRKSYFSVYNCFELANINDRSIFKSKVDFIVATVFNRDLPYFSDIIGSSVRDLHCYLIQVNTSHYGDSRIIKPSKTDIKNLIIVKGGLNTTILVEDLKIDRLRAFQKKEYTLQADDDNFKFTPPEFNKDDLTIRINDGDIFPEMKME